MTVRKFNNLAAVNSLMGFLGKLEVLKHNKCLKTFLYYCFSYPL